MTPTLPSSSRRVRRLALLVLLPAIAVLASSLVLAACGPLCPGSEPNCAACGSSGCETSIEDLYFGCICRMITCLGGPAPSVPPPPPVCGDGAVNQPTEQCDGTAGLISCQDIGCVGAPGTVTCTPGTCQLDTSGCSCPMGPLTKRVCDYQGCAADGSGQCAGGAPAELCVMNGASTSCTFQDASLARSGVYAYTVCVGNNSASAYLATTPPHCSVAPDAHALSFGFSGPGDDDWTTPGHDYLHTYGSSLPDTWSVTNCSNAAFGERCDGLNTSVIMLNVSTGMCDNATIQQPVRCEDSGTWAVIASETCDASVQCQQTYLCTDPAPVCRRNNTGAWVWSEPSATADVQAPDAAVWFAPLNVSDYATAILDPSLVIHGAWCADLALGADTGIAERDSMNQPVLRFTPAPGETYTSEYTFQNTTCVFSSGVWYRCSYTVLDSSGGIVGQIDGELREACSDTPGQYRGSWTTTTANAASIWSWREAAGVGLGSEGNCTDAFDNDCDGLVDGFDPDCRSGVRGRVTDENGVGLEGVIVKINFFPEGETTVTGADGGFLLSDVPPGDFFLDAQKPGYLSNSTLVSVVQFSFLELNLTLRNATCYRCGDFEGRCDVRCSGTDQCPGIVPPVCEGKLVGVWTQLNETTFTQCCEAETTRTRLTLPFAVGGCMPNLIQYTRVVRYAGEPVKLVFYAWEPCTG